MNQIRLLKDGVPALHAQPITRIVVNPNAVNHLDPDVYVARFVDADNLPRNVGEIVTVIQPEDDPEPDFVSTAVVREIDHEHSLIYLDIEWDGFHDEPAAQRFGTGA